MRLVEIIPIFLVALPEKHDVLLNANLESLQDKINNYIKNDTVENRQQIKNWFKDNETVTQFLENFARKPENRANFEIKKHQPRDDAEIRQNLTELSKRISESKQEDSNKPNKSN